MANNHIHDTIHTNFVEKAKDADNRIFAETLDYVIEKVRKNLDKFTHKFPSAGGVNGEYQPTENADMFLYSDWTSSFWTGMIWLAYEITGDERFKETGLIHTQSFRDRLDNNIILDHHDIGFLYTLSCEAAYKLTGDKLSEETAVLAAKKLGLRYRPIPGIIQRGGDLNDNDQKSPLTGLYIIDTCLNVPLLFWAGQHLADKTYFDMATNHMYNVMKYSFLEDYSVWQCVQCDIKTGEAIKKFRNQGLNEEGACWSRGQAWAMYGFAIAAAYVKDDIFFDAAKKACNYFLNNLQSDYTSNWDFYFKDDETPRDTSATAIAVCGLLELAKQLPVTDPDRAQYEAAAKVITQSLCKNYLYSDEESESAVLKGGVYAYNMDLCINEPVIWGDYYFMEALTRLVKHNRAFW